MTTEKKATRSQRKGAKEILRLGLKSLAFRKDLLSKQDADEFDQANSSLLAALKKKPVLSDELEEKAQKLDSILKKSGGPYYHKKTWVENVEMLLVAAIVVIGIRSFFIQPFIIPTNSMFPSFSGMQPKIYADYEKVPNFFERAMDKVFLGASHYKLTAQSSGELYLKLNGGAPFRFVDGGFPNGRFFVFPTTLRKYTFEIGGKEHDLTVPAEFDLDEVIARKFAGTEDLRDLPLIVTQDSDFSGNRLKLSERVIKKGETALAFDVLLGDALFVDRMSYNFISPQAGDPAVFRTGKIDEFNRRLKMPVRPIGEDKYYIKRIVGEPADSLEIRVPDTIFTNGTDVRKGVPGLLFKNNEVLMTQKAFRENNERTQILSEDPNAPNHLGFPGYRAEGLLTNRKLLRIPSKKDADNPTGIYAYFAMGDNSTDSLDGRSWGFVPENAIIGRAWFIYYPFTKRWGFTE